MAARTGSSSLPRAGNAAATASAVFGLLAVLSLPAAYALQYYSETVTLLQSTSAAALAIVFGLYAILLARRGRWTLARTIGRSGGGAAARLGRILGWIGLCLGTSVALAVGFYGLLTIFAKS